MASNSTQISAATVLVQLLQEHPDLPEAGWSIGTIFPELHGHVHGGGMAELSAYAEVLGGSVRADEVTYELQGQRVRAHRLNSVWRDVQVQVVVSLPVAAEAVAA
ncbi:hypothetical protein ACH4UM_18595 [Streptomyces sp. NPDC020801]|uniref:hypothetical protein n=1 Tax=Streptomyces sp. NPDC020801 TaxID=3365093 RepID=UPI003799077B